MRLIKTKSFELATNSEGNKSSDKLALILPGRLDTKDYECFNKHLKYLSEKGFYAVAVDPPGTWESGGGINVFTTTNYIKAINELILYFGNKPTLLFGHSRGGAVAMLAGCNNQYVRAIITVNESLGKPSPPSSSDVKDGYYIDHRDFPPGDAPTKKQLIFKVPLYYFEDGNKYDDSESLIVCKKPKLIFFSTRDEFNSPEHVKGLFYLAPKPKRLVELDSTHDYRYFPDVIETVNNEIGKFINKYFSN